MKNKNKIISLLLVMVFILSITFNNVSAATSITLAVIPVQQAKSEWCWAASCEMAGVWAHPYPSKTIDQYDVVKYVKGNLLNPYPNLPGSLSDSKAGSEYVTENNKVFYYTSRFSMSTIRSYIIDRSRPLQAGAGYYNSSGNRNGGHMVVINGAYTSGNSDTILYIDPYDGTEHWVSYSSFLDGSYNGRQYDQTVYY